MHVEHFFQDIPRQGPSDAWGFNGPHEELREELIHQLGEGPIPDEDDLSATIALTYLIHEELEACGTGKPTRLTNQQVADAQRTLKIALQRHSIRVNLPWRDFTTFERHWKRLGIVGGGSYEGRRKLLGDVFDPVERRFEQLEERQFHAILAEGVSPQVHAGWPRVDEELQEMKRLFRSASTTQDYRDVGNRCLAVLEALSRTIYDPQRHLRDGESEPPVDKTKLRIGRYVEDSLAGKDNEEVRGAVNKVIVLAHSVKHSSSPTRRDAGITADSVILLTNILRRVDEDS